jgi:polyhydroxybutyrate depolymerase
MPNRLHDIVRIAVLLIAALALFTPALPAQTSEVVQWQVDGVERRAILYPPSAKSPDGKAPLVFDFHGHGDNIQNFQYTEMQRAYPAAIVVYFQGLPSRRDGLSGWQVEKGQDDDRDLRLVDVALASLRGRFTIDDARIYATGFSNGAGFTYLLWAERASVFAAFAPVAARIRPTLQFATPRPVIHVAGAMDRQIRYLDQEEAIEAAKRANGATGKGTDCGKGCTSFDTGAADVMTWVHPGGHDYPAGTSERIARFFRQHPRK